MYQKKLYQITIQDIYKIYQKMISNNYLGYIWNVSKNYTTTQDIYEIYQKIYNFMISMKCMMSCIMHLQLFTV